MPAIVQDRLTGEVRMMAWMNQESLEATISTGKATFYSRSRGKLWIKGEESGNTLFVTSVRTDCDADTLLILCDPAGPSCHTGQDNCFFVSLDSDVDGAPKPMMELLENVLEERKQSTGEKSYTRSLFDGGIKKINSKIIEESLEVTQALENESDERVASEAADVLYHLLVGLRARGIKWRDVLKVLAGRFGTGGHVEKATRS